MMGRDTMDTLSTKLVPTKMPIDAIPANIPLNTILDFPTVHKANHKIVPSKRIT
jgi:hypothetical protein